MSICARNIYLKSVNLFSIYSW